MAGFMKSNCNALLLIIEPEDIALLQENIDMVERLLPVINIEIFFLNVF
jgi:nitrate reductase NapAB chaperone NapD